MLVCRSPLPSTVTRVSDAPPPPDDQPSTPPPSPTPPPPPPPSGLTPPPGYVAYQGQPTPAAPTRRIGGLVIPIVVSVSIVAVGTPIAAFLSAGVATDAADFLAGSLEESEFEDALVRLTSVQLLVRVATLATGVLTIVWMFLIANNVRAFGRATTWSPLFAIFGWFLPPLIL